MKELINIILELNRDFKRKKTPKPDKLTIYKSHDLMDVHIKLLKIYLSLPKSIATLNIKNLFLGF